MNDFYRHKKGDKIKWIITGIAFVLVFVFLAGLCMQLFGNDKIKPVNWFKKTEQTTPAVPEGPDENGGAIITDNETVNDGVYIKSKKLMRSEFDEYGISTQADDAFILTATVYPEEAFYKTVDWSIDWQNANSSWANGKNVNDYYSITPTSDGSTSANAVCKQAFAEPVIITCKLRTADISVAVKADYVKKLLDIEFNAPKYYLGDYCGATAHYTPHYSIGTITNSSLTFNYFYLSFPNEFYDLVASVANSAPDGLFDDYYSDEVNYPVDVLCEDFGGDDIESSFYDFFKLCNGISSSDRARAYNCYHKAVYDKYGNGIKENYLTYTIGYTYAIDGQTVRGEKSYATDLVIDIEIVATSLSINQIQIKH